MAITYTNDEIVALIGEHKRLSAGWRKRTQLRRKRGHDESYLDVVANRDRIERFVSEVVADDVS